MAKIVSKSNDQLIEEDWQRELSHYRNVRSELLRALDTYNTNKISGFSKTLLSIEEENNLQEWYYDVLDLKYDAIFNENSIPEQVKYFLPRGYFESKD